MAQPKIKYKIYQSDLPDDLNLEGDIAVDCETMGLSHHRDRLCLVQISNGDGEAHLVQLNKDYSAPNLKALLSDNSRVKIMHYARFDLATIWKYLNILAAPVYCTKIASKLARTYTDRHGLKELCNELLSIEISKQQQSSDWGAQTLSEAQCKYAATDVLYLHDIRDRLDEMLIREHRKQVAIRCFEFLPARIALDLMGWDEVDIFSH